ncbi:glycosyl hydrolase family 61-domain-containing protein [Phaeosphaeriaceae sp. PMI808]|nr:glycosyl hydrolase family 61-domain-containing protein [Phaeosphaeriaceae sp. PMI808]
MKTQSILVAALASAPAVLAHTVFTGFYVDGMPQGDGVAMRMSPNADTAGSPIGSLDSEDMACNVGGTKGVSRVQPVSDGATLSFEIREWANDPSKGRIDRGHKGPCAVYLKKVSSAIDDKGAGDGWFKVFDHGYDASTKRWCSDEIIDNNGLLNAKLPKGLEGGYYLARPEMLALHSAHAGDPQFYTGCAQIFVESNGNLGPQETVSIPGHVKYNQPGTSFDIYNTDNAKYTMPGPSVAKLVAKSGQAKAASSSQSQGLKPEGCLVENANWCGTEVSSYSDEKGCWAASEQCWAQDKTCWSSAPPTGGSGCETWQKRCEEIASACTAKNFNGPPNKGKVLTADKKAIDVGLIMATQGGGVENSPAPKTSATQKEEAKTSTPPKTTPVAGDKDPKPDTPAQAPAKPTSTAAAAPNAPAKPTPAAPQAPKPTLNDSYPTQPMPEKDDEEDEEDSNDSDSKPSKENNNKPVDTPKPGDNNKNKPADAPKPVSTITVPASGPAPTPGPGCQPGWKCVTVTEVETVTQTVYVTAAYDGYKRGVESFMRRKRAHMRHG